MGFLMSQVEQHISLRPATEADHKFLFEIFAGTREDLMLADLEHNQKQLLIEMQFRAREGQYRSAYPNATTSIIRESDREVGSIIVNRGEQDISVVDIAIDPAWRGRGIGTRVLRTLLAEACTESKLVHLQVAVTNRATRLYQRLGFSTIKDGGAYLSMEWRPSAAHSEVTEQT